MSMISICNATKAYHNGEIKNTVLNALSLHIDKGEFISFFGPNGCGKTTLLNIISGIDTLDSGQILIDNKPPVTAEIGYIFQDYRETIFPWMTVNENIAFPLRLLGEKKKERKEKVIELLKKLSIHLPLDEWPCHLSGGQQQLLVIARALMCEPGIMLFDEPFSALDMTTRIQMREKILNVWEITKTTNVFISHEIDEAIFLADRVVILGKTPTQILEIININLPRPRKLCFLEGDEFLRIRQKVLKVFHRALEQ